VSQSGAGLSSVQPPSQSAHRPPGPSARGSRGCPRLTSLSAQVLAGTAVSVPAPTMARPENTNQPAASLCVVGPMGQR
jgi:hypothetical protein